MRAQIYFIFPVTKSLYQRKARCADGGRPQKGAKTAQREIATMAGIPFCALSLSSLSLSLGSHELCVRRGQIHTQTNNLTVSICSARHGGDLEIDTLLLQHLMFASCAERVLTLQTPEISNHPLVFYAAPYRTVCIVLYNFQLHSARV